MTRIQHVARTLTPSAVCLAALLPLAGCTAASGPDVCTSEQELVTGQGVELQGLYLNAIVANGMYLNGRDLNGVSLQGVELQGIYINGRDLNGIYVNGLDLEGTELVGTADGVPVRGEDFVGSELDFVAADGTRVPLTIAAVAADPEDPDLVYTSLETSGGENVCGPGGRGLFLRGVWDETGARRDSFEVDGETIRATYSCTDGVLAKCLRWGYQPWESGAALHQSCTRMARADYCGDGVGHTENGTAIDLFDHLGIQVSESSPADGFAFEAGWGPDGAVCASRPRYLDVEPDGDERLPSCFSELPRCTDWETAKSHGALTGNASVPQTRFLCD